MSTALVPIGQTAVVQAAGWESKVDLIKRTIAKGASNDELEIFLHQCRKTGLDPLAKQIYFQKRKNKKGEDQMTIIVGIDGFRLIADRSKIYAGNDDPVFDNEEKPTKATVTVYKLVSGQRMPFTASARWSQYYPGDYLGFMWNKMPHLMLGKCAEALALRKAFPAELSGVYIPEEMHQAGGSHEQFESRDYEVNQSAAAKCEKCAGDIVDVDNPQGGKYKKLTAAQAIAYSEKTHGASWCWECIVKAGPPKQEEKPADHPTVAAMKERQVNSEPDPNFIIDTQGKPVVAGTVTQVSITAKSFQVHFGKERLSTFPNRSMCEHLKGSKGQFVILEYSISPDGKYKNIEAIRKIGDREFIDNLPAYQLNEDPEPPAADMKDDGEELPF